MTLLILLLSASIISVGLLIALQPKVFLEILRTHAESFRLYMLAIIFRMIFGTLLIYLSTASKFPYTIAVIGWLALVAAITFILIGQRNFSRMLIWLISQAKPLVYIGGIFAIAFGGFLLYAFIGNHAIQLL